MNVAEVLGFGRLGFLVLSFPHVKFPFTSVVLCLVFVAYFLFYFISQSSCVQLRLSWLCAPVSQFFPAMSNPQEPSECESCHSCAQCLSICYHRFVLADIYGILWIYFAISVHGFCNSGPWTTKQVQHTKGISPLSVSTGLNTGERYKQSHETIISLPRQPRVFPAYSHESVAVSDNLKGAFSRTDDFSYTETDSWVATTPETLSDDDKMVNKKL